MNFRWLGALGLGILTATSFGQNVAQGEVLVKFAPNSHVAEQAMHQALGTFTIDRSSKLGWARVKLPANMTVTQGIAKLKRYRAVKGVSANPLPVKLEIPNDPMIGQQWHVNRIKLTEAWDIETGDPAVKIAILDTGVDLTHPDLQSKLLPGTDPGDGDNNPQDEDGHGTHVAGLSAAATNNGLGVVGVGRDASILPVKVFGGRGGIAVADGIVWAADNGAQVINMSLKIGDFQALRDAVAYAKSRNVLMIAAAGNDGNTAVNLPAGYPDVMAVASSDPDDARSGFSTYGNWVDVAAPGSNLHSTFPGSYGGASGTSMASPVVAGLAALVWSRSGLNSSYLDIWETIEDSCDPAPGNYVRKGRVNALEAVQSATIIITEEISAVNVATFVGSHFLGDLTSLEDLDGNSLVLNTENITRFGTAAGFEVAFDVIGDPGIYFNWKLAFTGKASTQATGMIWLKRVSNGQWVHVRSFPLNSTESTQAVKLAANMNPYIALDGTIQMRIRAHVPHRTNKAANNFTFEVNQVQMTAEYEEAP
jgi:thermitase